MENMVLQFLHIFFWVHLIKFLINITHWGLCHLTGNEYEKPDTNPFMGSIGLSLFILAAQLT